MKIKTSELVGKALDYAVCVAEKRDFYIEGGELTFRDDQFGDYATEWDQGGPLMQREQIGVIPEANDGSVWKAQFTYCRKVLRLRPIDLVYSYCMQRGPTPLVAVMRCYVASKLGDEVEIPQELL